MSDNRNKYAIKLLKEFLTKLEEDKAIVEDLSVLVQQTTPASTLQTLKLTIAE